MFSFLLASRGGRVSAAAALVTRIRRLHLVAGLCVTADTDSRGLFYEIGNIMKVAEI